MLKQVHSQAERGLANHWITIPNTPKIFGRGSEEEGLCAFHLTYCKIPILYNKPGEAYITSVPLQTALPQTLKLRYERQKSYDKPKLRLLVQN